MKHACNSCGARYAIPESRVKAAGKQGLRVRCSRCRAIMAVCWSDVGAAKADEDITQPLGVRRNRMSIPARGVAAPMHTEVGMAAADAGPAPAVLSSSGVYRPLPGVSRSVTGLHMPSVGAAMPGRDWYAAFGGRARGPYSRAELELLAEQGRVRSSTLVWRPGFAGWQRVRDDGGPHEGELAWLRDIVLERKRRERAASDKAAREHGIHRIHLDDLSTPKTPPLPVMPRDSAAVGDADRPVLLVGRSLPSDSFASEGEPAYAADKVFGQTRFGALGRKASPARDAGERRLLYRRAFLVGALVAVLGFGLALYVLPALGIVSPDVVAAFASLFR